MNKISLTIILSLVLAFPLEISAQISKDEIRKIDSLEYLVPNIPDTRFNIASA